MDEKTIERVKKISVELLSDFDTFCKEHNLKYSLSFGTLLGAVRHKGFIPWDDDIDVDMSIDDYIRLGKLWSKYGDKDKYFLQTKKTDPKIPCPFYRLRLNNTAWIEPGHETFPIHWGIPLDIFPVYNLPQNTVMRKAQRKLAKYSRRLSRYDWEHKESNVIKSWLYQKLTLLCLQGIYLISILAKSSPYVYYADGYSHKKEGKKKWLFPCKTIMFEGIELQSYADPHAYLTWQYGENYMTPPPIDQRGGHAVAIIDFEHDGEYYTKCLRRNK